MLPNGAAFVVFDGARFFGDVLVQKVSKRAFSNEANASGVFLFGIGQANFIGNAAPLDSERVL